MSHSQNTTEFLGYCPFCGRDVETDFCYHCGRYTQKQAGVKMTFGELKHFLATLKYPDSTSIASIDLVYPTTENIKVSIDKNSDLIIEDLL
jgi:hypothetical protein